MMANQKKFIGCLSSHDRRGFSPVEIMIAVSMFLIVLSAMYSVTKGSQKAYTQGKVRLNLHQDARRAMKVIENDLRFIGYGIRRGHSPFIDARKTSLEFRGDITRGSTILVNDVSSGDEIHVKSVGGIESGDSVYLLRGNFGGMHEDLYTVWYTLPTLNPPKIRLTSSLSSSYVSGSDVNVPKVVEYRLVGNIIRRKIGSGGLKDLLDNVKSFEFKYYDEGDIEIPFSGNQIPSGRLDEVRRIRVVMTVDSSSNLSESLTLVADVRPRNL